MKSFYAIVTLVFFFGCGLSTKPDIEVLSGTMYYSNVVGKTLYHDNNLAIHVAGFVGLMPMGPAIEKWQFYDDSIIVYVTRYNSYSMQALDQFKYVAEVLDKDVEWVDNIGEGWRTTGTVWSVYAREINGCGWAPIYSYTSAEMHLIVHPNPYGTSGIGIGTYEIYDNAGLENEPRKLVYQEGWVPGLCGFVQ